MRQKAEKNYYELLDVTPGSTIEDIEEGYRQAMKLYGGGGGEAVYSLYSKEEREALVEMVRDAYETLRDPQKKMTYDSLMIKSASVDEEETPEVDIAELRAGDGTPYRTSWAEGVKDIVRLSSDFTLDGAEPMLVEQYRILCSRLEETRRKNGSSAFAFTSAVKGEGKSTTSLNLAWVAATEYRKKTILVELDLRKASTLAKSVGKTGGIGLSEVLRGERDVFNAISRVEGTSLYVLLSGNTGGRPAELLGSPRVKATITALKAEFDYVMVDCPPVLPLADMNLISRNVDELILVVRAGKTNRDLVAKAVASMKEARMAGVVLNGAQAKLKKYYY